MLSTHSVHRDSWTQDGPGRASEGAQPAESTEVPRVGTDMRPCIVVAKCRTGSSNSSRPRPFGRPDGGERHILTAIKSGLCMFCDSL